MPQFDPELIQVIKSALEEVMTRVPSEYSTVEVKAFLADDPRGDRWRGLVVSALGPGPSRCGVGPRDGNVAQNVGLKLNL